MVNTKPANNFKLTYSIAKISKIPAQLTELHYTSLRYNLNYYCTRLVCTLRPLLCQVSSTAHTQNMRTFCIHVCKGLFEITAIVQSLSLRGYDSSSEWLKKQYQKCALRTTTCIILAQGGPDYVSAIMPPLLASSWARLLPGCQSAARRLVGTTWLGLRLWSLWSIQSRLSGDKKQDCLALAQMNKRVRQKNTGSLSDSVLSQQRRAEKSKGTQASLQISSKFLASQKVFSTYSVN